DGNIEFLGRIDNQVKIRGFRIELGEIEAALADCDAVDECIVTAREDEPGDKRLVAYLTEKVESTISIADLRTSLKRKLPEYMVPSAFVILKAMPLTPNGKIDRRALPAPERSRSQLDSDFTAARTPIEEMTAGIWAELLGVEQVGVHDNFFELGGHSLLATQVISRLRDAFQIELPLRTLFVSPTVAETAQKIASHLEQGTSLETSEIEPISRDGELPLSFAQQRLWFLDQLETGSSSYNMPAAVRLKGVLKADALEQSFREIVRRHEVLRTTFRMVNGRPIQVIAPIPSDVT